MKTWKTILGAGLCVALLFAVTSADLAQDKTPAKTSAAAKSTAPKSSYDPALLKPATLTAKAPETFEVKFTTTKGDFTIKVTREWAPNGADRFYNLVRHHFYDGDAFFRVLPNFVAQFGLSPFPDVSKAWSSATIKDDPVKASNKKGFVTYAMAGANTRTTQLFINLANNDKTPQGAPYLDASGFSPFGEVTDGMDVIEKLYSGYGEGAPRGRGPDQGKIEAEGRAYLEKSFPELDTIKTAVITSPAPSAPAKSPSKSAAKSPAKKSS